MKREDSLYQAFYCEENIWKLCQDSYFKDLEVHVCVITNEAQCCAFLKQRAGVADNEDLPKDGPFEGLLTWDYHVVLLSREAETWLVYDFDTLLDFPTALQAYLKQTFSPFFPKPYQPFFRLIPASHYLAKFCSDRSHMLNERREYMAPVPPWEAPDAGAGGTNLAELIDLKNKEWGKPYNLVSLRQALLK